MVFNNILRKFVFLIAGLLISVNLYAVNPYDSSFGNEYSLECYQIVEKEINAFIQRNTQQVDEVYNSIINRFANFTILEKAKYYQKYRSLRRKKIRELSTEDRETIKSYAHTAYNLSSCKIVTLLFSEASDYCSSLFKEEEDKRNKVDISPSDRTIQYYLVINPQKFANGAAYDTTDLKPSGELLITPGGVIKAMSFSDGWKKIVSYNRKVVAPGWIQLNIDYFVWPYIGDGDFPNTVVFIKSSDNP